MAKMSPDALRDMFGQAVSTGEVLRIVYHGGSQPGSVREVRPISVTDDELFAHDLASGESKTFKLAKIEIPDPAANPPAYEPIPVPPPEEVRPIGAVFAERVGELAALGWHVEVAEDSISLHGFFKNGKPRKSSDVSLDYEEFTYDYTDENGDHSRKSMRPYHVRSERLVTRSFGSLSPAVALFWEEARHLAPAK